MQNFLEDTRDSIRRALKILHMIFEMCYLAQIQLECSRTVDRAGYETYWYFN